MLGIQTKQMTTLRSCICPWFTDTMSIVCNSSPSYLKEKRKRFRKWNKI